MFHFRKIHFSYWTLPLVTQSGRTFLLSVTRAFHLVSKSNTTVWYVSKTASQWKNLVRRLTFKSLSSSHSTTGITSNCFIPKSSWEDYLVPSGPGTCPCTWKRLWEHPASPDGPTCLHLFPPTREHHPLINTSVSLYGVDKAKWEILNDWLVDPEDKSTVSFTQT